MSTPLAGGQENSFAPQMIFLWPPARGVGKSLTQLYNPLIAISQYITLASYMMFKIHSKVIEDSAWGR